MKKKIATLLIAGALIGLAACGETTEEAPVAETAQQEEATEEPAEEPVAEPVEEATEAPEETTAPESAAEDDGTIAFDGTGYNVTYVKHEVGEDYEGNPCLLYYYNFTNNGEDNASAAVTSYVQCLQNGVQCQTAFTEENNDSINNYMMEVQPGSTVEVCQVYGLSDMSDVTIEVSDLISFSDDKDTQIIKLQ